MVDAMFYDTDLFQERHPVCWDMNAHDNQTRLIDFTVRRRDVAKLATDTISGCMNVTVKATNSYSYSRFPSLRTIQSEQLSVMTSHPPFIASDN